MVFWVVGEGLDEDDNVQVMKEDSRFICVRPAQEKKK